MHRKFAIAALFTTLAISGARLAAASPILISTTTDLGDGLFAYDLVLDGQDDEYRSFFAQEFTFTGDLLGFNSWYDPTDSMASYLHAPWTGNPMGAPVQTPGSYKFSAGTGGGSQYLGLPVARVVVAGDLTVTGSIGRGGILFDLSGSFSSTQSYATIESVHNVPDWQKQRNDPVVPPEPEVVLPVDLIDPPSVPEPTPEPPPTAEPPLTPVVPVAPELTPEPDVTPDPPAPEPISDPQLTPEPPTDPGPVLWPIIGPNEPVPIPTFVGVLPHLLDPDNPLFWGPNTPIYLSDLTINVVPDLLTEGTHDTGFHNYGDTPRLESTFTTTSLSTVMFNRSLDNLATPEPATWLLAAVGAAILMAGCRRTRNG